MEIVIRMEEDGLSLSSLDVKGAGDGYNPTVLALMIQAELDYMCHGLNVDREIAMANLCRVMMGYLKAFGVTKSGLKNLVDMTYDTPNVSTRH